MVNFLLLVLGTRPSFVPACQCNLLIFLALGAKSIKTIFVATGVTMNRAHIVETITAVVQESVLGTYPACR